MFLVTSDWRFQDLKILHAFCHADIFYFSNYGSLCALPRIWVDLLVIVSRVQIACGYRALLYIAIFIWSRSVRAVVVLEESSIKNFFETSYKFADLILLWHERHRNDMIKFPESHTLCLEQ